MQQNESRNSREKRTGFWATLTLPLPSPEPSRPTDSRASARARARERERARGIFHPPRTVSRTFHKRKTQPDTCRAFGKIKFRNSGRSHLAQARSAAVGIWERNRKLRHVGWLPGQKRENSYPRSDQNSDTSLSASYQRDLRKVML